MQISTNGVQTVSSASEPTRAVHTLIHDCAATNIAVGPGWTEIIAASVIPSLATEMEVFLPSGEPVQIGFGAAAAEDDVVTIVPGGNGRVPVDVAAGVRVAARVDASGSAVDAGNLIINFYGP